MMDDDSKLAHLRRQLRKQMNDHADAAATGVPQDWAAYQKLVGLIQGLAMAESELLDLAKKGEEEDESTSGGSS